MTNKKLLLSSMLVAYLSLMSWGTAFAEEKLNDGHMDEHEHHHGKDGHADEHEHHHKK